MDAANPSPATTPPAPPAPAPTKLRTWPHAVQTSLFVMVIAGIVGLLTHSLLHGNVQRPAANSGEPPLTRLDLNHASRAELRLLPGVGEKMAERIDAYRILHGPYASIDDLRKVPGIGPKTIERLRPWLIVTGTPAAAAPTTTALSPELLQPDMLRTSKREVSLAEPIDINTAGVAELQKLPGIGPKLSQRIVDARTQAHFKTVDELRRVPGIGPKTLEKVRPYVTAGAGDVATR